MLTLKKLLITATGVLLIISAIISLWPAKPAIPLITKQEWIVTGQAFQNSTANLYELPDSIRDSHEMVYWRTWSPETQATMAQISTRPFKPTRYMAIPYGGFAGEKGIRLDLTCSSNQKVLDVASARTNGQMTAVLLRTPEKWCDSDVILTATSTNKDKFIEVGTPFSISLVDYYKNSFVGLFAIFVVVFLAVWGCVFLPCAFANTYLRTNTSTLAGPIFLGVFGYLMFFVYFASHRMGILLSELLFIVEALGLLWFWRFRYQNLVITWQFWKQPTAIWASVAFAAFCLATAVQNGAGPWTINALFTPVQWSSDNQLPVQISEYLFHGHDPRQLALGPWKVSDRPPLAYGLMSTFRFLSWLLASHKDGYALYFQYQLITGIVINGLWAVALYFLLRALRLDQRTLMVTLLAVALTPFAIFNSTYIWPKMLGAAFGLFAFLKLFEPEKYLEYQKHGRMGHSLVPAAALSALALLSHGGTAFGVIAAIIVAVWYRKLPSIGTSAIALLVGIALLAPWFAWQHLEQPPGNALVKYAFSGNFGFGEEQKGVIATIVNAYAPLTVIKWLGMKLNALKVLLIGSGSMCGVQELGPVNSFFGQLRSQDFFYFGPSLRFLAIGFIPLLFSRRFVSPETRSSGRLHLIRLLVGTGLLSIGLYALVGFDCYINHMQAYQAMLGILAGLALTLRSTKLWFFQLTLQIVVLYGLVVWMLDPIANSQQVFLVPIALLCGLGLAVYRWITKIQSRHVI